MEAMARGVLLRKGRGGRQWEYRRGVRGGRVDGKSRNRDGVGRYVGLKVAGKAERGRAVTVKQHAADSRRLRGSGGGRQEMAHYLLLTNSPRLHSAM